MALLKCLEVISSKPQAVGVHYPLLNLEEVLSNHTARVGIVASVAFSELALFSRIEDGSVLFVKKNEFHITSLEINNQTLRVQNV